MPRIPSLGLTLVLVLLAPIGVFAAMIAADRHFGALGPDRSYVVRLELPPAGGQTGLPKIEGPLDASRPLVVIDAGHGGHDPGAGAGRLHEKDLTLALARALRDRLLAGGGVRVAMTRDDDRYLLLEERSGIARRLQADLFVSIHADSAGASEARGATVYTLSARGSSQEAERLAATENRADTVNGVVLGKGDSDVDAILVDLSQRQAEARAAELARLILREGEGRITFRERPLQSAAFVVLKSPDTPSVLFEAGYISNAEDAARLASREGREAFADATARAIRVWLARQSAAAP
ncbi:MAG: N-acetylmuramoyl-L-alanine amidase [Sphingomonadales bacterium]|nr:N-acetylmuramoyl-L-alanine amidase [Sphingomonadales bacterium]